MKTEKNEYVKEAINELNGAIEKVRELIRKYKTSKNFGNARFIRNIYEKAIVKHASNVKNKKQKKILITLTEKDINDENLLK